MKFITPLASKNLTQLMRSCGYAPQGQNSKNEYRFVRPIQGRAYPRYHVYCVLAEDKSQVICNLHIDQKQPSYKGNAAHSGEYSGLLVEQEAQRIQTINKL